VFNYGIIFVYLPRSTVEENTFIKNNIPFIPRFQNSHHNLNNITTKLLSYQGEPSTIPKRFSKEVMVANTSRLPVGDKDAVVLLDGVVLNQDFDQLLSKDIQSPPRYERTKLQEESH
jgi:hypothetical protein